MLFSECIDPKLITYDITNQPARLDSICIPRHRAISENHPSENNHHKGLPRSSSRDTKSLAPFIEADSRHIRDVSLDWSPYQKELDLSLRNVLRRPYLSDGIGYLMITVHIRRIRLPRDSVAAAESPAWALILLQEELPIFCCH